MYNLYVKNKTTDEVIDFNGLSIGETRQMLLDLYKRDLRLSGIPEANVETQGQQYENMLYDELSPNDIASKVWVFSDKTVTIKQD